jgi:hypothetical protein
MQRFLTRLDKGIYQQDDTLNAPKDTLKRATGARYIRDTGYLAPALGRRFLGSYWPPAGHGSHRREIPEGFDGIASVGSLAWIKGSTADGSHPELAQIAWVEKATLKTIEALPSVDDPSMGSSGARTAGSVAGIGNGPMQVVKLGATGQLAMTCGGIPHVLRRTTTGTKLDQLGIGYQEIPPIALALTSGGTVNIGPAKIYTFWYTVKDPDTGYESASLLPACANYAVDGSFAFVPQIQVFAPADAPANSSAVRWLQKVLNDNWTVRLYCAVSAWDGTTSITTETGWLIAGVAAQKQFLSNTVGKLGWPVGGLVSEKNGAQLALAAITIRAPGEVFDRTYYGLGTITSGAAVLDLTPLYNFVTISEDGENSDDAMDGPPPSCTTMDEFQGSLCVNDLNDPRKGSYSIPGKYSSFPRGSHFINFNDDIVAIVTIEKKQGWLCRHSTYAVNWLPRQSDSDFSRGTIKELLSPTRGCVSVAAQTKVMWPGYGAACVWVSDDGIYISDWVRVPERITPQLAWPMGGVPEQMKLVDDPDRSRLELYVPVGDHVDQYYLYYDVPHLQGIIPAIVGPNPRTAVAAATQALVADGSRRIVTSDRVGSLFYEDIGHQDTSMVTQGDLTTGFILMTAESHLIYPADIGAEMEVKRVMAVARNLGAMDLGLRFNKLDEFDSTLFNVPLLPQQEPVLIRTVNRRCESVQFRILGSNDTILSEVGFLYDVPGEARR